MIKNLFVIGSFVGLSVLLADSPEGADPKNSVENSQDSSKAKPHFTRDFPACVSDDSVCASLNSYGYSYLIPSSKQGDKEDKKAGGREVIFMKPILKSSVTNASKDTSSQATLTEDKLPKIDLKSSDLSDGFYYYTLPPIKEEFQADTKTSSEVLDRFLDLDNTRKITLMGDHMSKGSQIIVAPHSDLTFQATGETPSVISGIQVGIGAPTLQSLATDLSNQYGQYSEFRFTQSTNIGEKSQRTKAELTRITSASAKTLTLEGDIYLSNGSSLLIVNEGEIHYSAKMRHTISYPKSYFYAGDQYNKGSFRATAYQQNPSDITTPIAQDLFVGFIGHSLYNTGELYFSSPMAASIALSKEGEGLHNGIQASTIQASKTASKPKDSNEALNTDTNQAAEATETTETTNKVLSSALADSKPLNDSKNLSSPSLEHTAANITKALNNPLVGNTHFTDTPSWQEGRISVYDWGSVDIQGNLTNHANGTILLVDGGFLKVNGDFKNSGWLLSGAIDTNRYGYMEVSGKATLAASANYGIISRPDSPVLGNRAYLLLQAKGGITLEGDTNNPPTPPSPAEISKTASVDNPSTPLSSAELTSSAPTAPAAPSNPSESSNPSELASPPASTPLVDSSKTSELQGNTLAALTMAAVPPSSPSEVSPSETSEKNETPKQTPPQTPSAPINIPKDHIHLFTASKKDGALTEVKEKYLQDNLTFETQTDASKQNLYVIIKPSESSRAKSIDTLIKQANDDISARKDLYEKISDLQANRYVLLEQIQKLKILDEKVQAYEASIAHASTKEEKTKLEQNLQELKTLVADIKATPTYQTAQRSITMGNNDSYGIMAHYNSRAYDLIDTLFREYKNRDMDAKSFPELSPEEFSKFKSAYESFAKKTSEDALAVITKFRDDRTHYKPGSSELYQEKVNAYNKLYKEAQEDLKSVQTRLEAGVADKIKESEGYKTIESTEKEKEAYKDLKTYDEEIKKYQAAKEKYNTLDNEYGTEAYNKKTEEEKKQWNTDYDAAEEAYYDAVSKKNNLDYLKSNLDYAIKTAQKKYLDEQAKTELANAPELQAAQKKLVEAKLAFEGDDDKHIPSAYAKVRAELEEKLKESDLQTFQAINDLLAAMKKIETYDFVEKKTLTQRQSSILEGIRNLSDAYAVSIIAHASDPEVLQKLASDVDDNLESLAKQTQHNSVSKSVDLIASSLVQNRLTMLSNPFATPATLSAVIQKLSKQHFAADENIQSDAFNALIEPQAFKEEQTMALWGSVVGGYAQAGGNSVIYGGSVGYDAMVGEHFIAGIQATYAYAKNKSDGGISNHSHNIQAAAYSRYFAYQNELDISLSYNIGFVNQNRQMRILDTASEQSADYTSQQGRIGVNYGYLFAITAPENHFYIKPLVGLSGLYSIQGAYEETGLNIGQKGSDYFNLNANVGLEFRKYFTDGGYFYVIPGVEYQVLSTQDRIGYSIGGVEIINDLEKKTKLYYTGFAGAEFKFSTNTYGFGSLGVKIANNEQYYNGALGLKYKF
ncbi:hypothetical protein BKH46_05880 [Helicobacter sp. 12S02634-8]|uniref:autotransporter outer membrane beta-barrel domain-containing protein n=1 Tax=Helicobacter sp. 12S02634-8 TaxID=1476199 RepID=UPI000BA66947|nr:autotransporter domain-containing protein [Helicobacter sp. 12S02634-8]PAF46965.1 hypothetical protein BKH46_05880 [Helicobacter sp. 12S02634-8]